jgi:hypothetical protein
VPRAGRATEVIGHLPHTGPTCSVPGTPA